MTPLAPELRKLLENAIPTVRERAERAAEALLNTYAVNRPDPFPGMSEAQRRMRNGLRARARQLGNGVQAEGLEPLKSEIAYEQWHRMVFARFLAENGLLRHPSGVAVTLQDCAELAAEEGEADAWATAAKYASVMLPGIFRPEDPAAQLRLAPEGRNALESMLNGFPSVVFTADDSLGWMYQFWQSKKKKEVNDSERKIGGADIAPVTQLFTEDYMVRFLLENSLGAWWAGRHPGSPLLKKWEYLRFKEDGTPAAGTFPGWPLTAAELTLMDPCCGSGHFLVAGFEMQVDMRMEDEGLGEAEAAKAVLRDNIYGLELDPRCTQIAAFALALAAWKRGGYRSLPVPNVACSGIPVQGQLETWLKLAGKDARLRAALEHLYQLFSDAPDLGSLIDPADLPQNEMFMASYEEVAPIFEQAVTKERIAADPVAEIFGIAAESVANAVRLLAANYTLVITNVPYLVRGRQVQTLKDFCETYHRFAQNDLATVFIERCFSFCRTDGAIALVTPQNWLFLGMYKKFREKILSIYKWNFIAKLGESGFESTQAAGAFTAMSIITKSTLLPSHMISGIDASSSRTPSEKSIYLRQSQIQMAMQSEQLKNPDAIILFDETGKSIPRLNLFTKVIQGVGTTDTPRFVVRFWEIPIINKYWVLYQLAPNGNEFSGYTSLLRWEEGKGDLARIGTAHKGKQALGKRGFSIAVTRTPYVAAFLGTRFDCTAAILLVNIPSHFSAVRAYLLSSTFEKELRRIDQALSVTESSFGKVPFDLDHWQKVAEQAGPLPEPQSDDPTQWLFNGHPASTTAPLQVAAARLLGYHWPQQTKDDLDSLVDEDGIVCLPSAAGEPPMVERLRSLLVNAYGEAWVSERTEAELLAAVGAPGKSLDEWLRDDFFPQHCRLFHNRPFVWHISDGRKDGFSALVNYHKLDTARLDKLIFTYLGDWIRFQRARRDHGEPGSDGRLVAALELEKKLKAIKEGEPPYDIYVRWKPLSKQPLGWNPDLNDGVRLNIRPFVTAGVLRSRFTINWNKDRGKNPDGSERLNDLHYTLTEKRSAREAS